MIRAIDYETGAVTSIADISNPNGMVLAADGNLLILHPMGRIRTLNVTTGISTLSSDICSTCGEGIAINSDGTTIVSGGYHHVHLIDVATGAVSILAGKSSAGMNNGIGTNSEFHFPVGVAFMPTGDVVVADLRNNMIRKISAHDADVTTLAGDSTGVGGFADGSLSAATFHAPVGILATPDGNSIYVTERGNKAVRWINLLAGTVSTLAGSGSVGSATFDFYHGYMALGSSSLIIADASAHVIRDIAYGSCQCNAGFSGPDGGTCLACAPGRFKGGIGSGDCVECPLGTYQNESHASTCWACEAGAFQNSSAASGCQKCPAGFFSAQEGQTSCTSCPAGSTSPAGSATHAQCACGHGATLLPPGEVSTLAGAGSSSSGSADGAC